MCCFKSFYSFEIDLIVAIYGLLWYLNSIYGIILMIIESNNVCFFDWCPICIINILIPLLWLLIIRMVDSCCIKYWSLNKWNRRHYGAAFLYFAIFTNQLLIFGFLCFYGFSVWSIVSSPTCNASDHLYYGFFLLLSISTLLILSIGFYQFYAATKYLCTYHAVLDVKRRQQNATCIHMKLKSDKTSNKLNNNGRKYSLESNSAANSSSMSLTWIGSIFRYGSETNDDDDDDNEDHNEPHDDGTLPITALTPLPSLNIRNTPSETEELQLMNLDNNEKEIELSQHSLSSETEHSPSAFNIEIAGIVIPTRKFTKKGQRKRHKHKSYKAVASTMTPNDDGDDVEKEEYNAHKNMIEIKQINNEKEEEEKQINEEDRHRKKHLFSLPFFGKALLILSHYFERLKEDPSTADLCIICYDSFHIGDYLARLKCRHVYHKNCIRIWMANNRDCPLCDMNEKNINLKFKIFT